MTLPTFAIASSCLLLGATSGFVVAKLAQDSVDSKREISSSSVQGAAVASNAAADINSPFSLVATPAGIEEDVVQSEGLHAQPLQACTLNIDAQPDFNNVIDYSRLSDYNQLLSTLSQISQADGSLVHQWIDEAPAFPETPSVSRAVIRALFQKLSELEPASTTTWIENHSVNVSDSTSNTLLHDAIVGYSIAQPVDAESWLATLDQEGPQQALVFSLTTALGSMDPERMLAQLTTDDGQYYGYSIVSEWTQNDPQNAFAWLQNRASEHEKEMYQSAILEGLIRQDPDAAMAYLQESPGVEDQAWLFSEYASLLVQSDPLAALDWAFEQGDPVALEHTISELAWSLPEENLATLQARIEGIEDDALRERIVVNSSSRLLSQFAEDDPSAAMAWVDNQSPAIQSQLRPEAVLMWLYSDPTSAIEWLRQQPLSSDRERLLEAVVWELPEHDIDLALDTFPNVNSNTQIGLIGPMIAAIQRDRPSQLQQWVAELDHPDVERVATLFLNDQAQLSQPELFLAELDQATGEERMDMLATLYRSGDTIDRTLFEQWIAENPLTPADEMALQQRFSEIYPGGDGHC